MKIRNQQSQVMLFAITMNLFISFAAAGIRGSNAGYGYAAMGVSGDGSVFQITPQEEIVEVYVNTHNIGYYTNEFFEPRRRLSQTQEENVNDDGNARYLRRI